MRLLVAQNGMSVSPGRACGVDRRPPILSWCEKTAGRPIFATLCQETLLLRYLALAAQTPRRPDIIDTQPAKNRLITEHGDRQRPPANLLALPPPLARNDPPIRVPRNPDLYHTRQSAIHDLMRV